MTNITEQDEQFMRPAIEQVKMAMCDKMFFVTHKTIKDNHKR
jgi:hypothetical protein